VDDASQAINREKALERQFEEAEKNWERDCLLLRRFHRDQRRESIYYKRSRVQRDQRKKRKTGG
jgi:hypothetical protein